MTSKRITDAVNAMLLAREIGDDLALKVTSVRVLVAMTPYLRKLSRRFAGMQRGSLEFDDLFQLASLACIRACRKFKAGNSFPAYVSFWARSLFTAAGPKHLAVSGCSSHRIEHIEKVRRAQSRFLTKTGRQGTVAELAHESGLSEARVDLALEFLAISCHGGAIESLSTPCHVEDVLIDNIDARAFGDTARRFLAKMPAHERAVINLRLGLEDGISRTFEEIVTLLGHSRQYHQQIYNKAIAKLRLRLGAREASCPKIESYTQS